ncbi:hypothetical protein CMU84_08300 [Elizabethkingia anophelis]|nr:hypothetical protein [Elizabethkingia anophelis]MDV3706768.1 hypothetical protein [Elizabethkingia anophelis]MDV3735225.1 hypothetical protein [Elizabethkingia anophelis]
MKSIIYFLLIPFLYSCQNYNKPPFDKTEENLRNSPLSINQLIIDSLWTKRDSLTYLRFKNIKKIYISETDSIPNWILNFKELTSIEAFPSNKKINFIPNEIGKLTELTHLELPENNITEIPQSLYTLKKLQRINLSKNNLKEIKKEISQLKDLKIILLSDNSELKDLPNEICNLLSLKNLPINGTKIKSLPFCLKNSLNLESIDISNTPIRNFPIEILENKKLKEIGALNTKLENYKEVKSICEKRNITFFYDE